MNTKLCCTIRLRRQIVVPYIPCLAHATHLQWCIASYHMAIYVALSEMQTVCTDLDMGADLEDFVPYDYSIRVTSCISEDVLQVP